MSISPIPATTACSRRRSSGASYTQSTVGSGLNVLEGVAVDGSGNVLISDIFHNRVIEVDAVAGLADLYLRIDRCRFYECVADRDAGQHRQRFADALLCPKQRGLVWNPVNAANTCCRKLDLRADRSRLAQLRAGGGRLPARDQSVCEIARPRWRSPAMSLTRTTTSTWANTMQYVTLSGTGTNVVPAVTAVSPATGPTAGGTTARITGTNLTGATAVMFGGTPAISFVYQTLARRRLRRSFLEHCRRR